MYKCSGCDFLSDYRSTIVNHINKAKKCSTDLLEVIKLDIKIKCDYCEKELYDKNTKKRHLKTCKKKISQENEENERKIKDLENKVEELNSKLSSSSGSTIITNNIQQQNNVIIQITPYNDPNLEGLEKYYLMALKKLFMSVPTIIEKVHFNTEYPENHNICISNYRNKLAKVFNGKEWRTMDEDKLIEQLMNTYETLLEGWAEDDEERMKYIEKYNDIKNTDNKKIDEIKEEIKNMIYDKRGMVKIKNT